MESLLSTMQSFMGSTAASVSAVNIVQTLHGDDSSASTSSSNTTLVTPASTTLGFSEGPNLATDAIRYPLFTPAPSPNRVDERLDFFRSRMLPSFPFIDLNPEMTSCYLRQNRPFLLQAIQTVTTFSTQERFTQVEELKRTLFTSALLQVQSNIDLLLGLLTYLAWSTDPFLGRADLVSRLMMLAISLVYDLRLFKPSSPDVQLMMTITQGRADDNNPSPKDQTPYDLLERQRAVLACFILSSNIASHLGRQDALRWTPQMEEALQVLTLAEACSTDRLFVPQVRLQLLKQRADDVRQQDEARTATAPALVSAPHLLYLKTLRKELHELRSTFPPDLPRLDILNAQAQYVELYINQLAYSISQDSPPLNLSGLLGFERLECLWLSVENIKSWLDHFYQIPCSNLVGQPFHFWSQMILTITLLKYLSTLQDPEWDCQAVRDTVHLISTMDGMIQKLDLSSEEPELQCDDHLLKFLSKLLIRCRLWAEARWHDEETRQGRSANSDTTGHNHHIPELDKMVWMQSMDLGDDQWFENVLGMPTTFY
ncbi:hypothetical protein CNMCM6936_001766 [Aspergillus lentulus]|uniref:Transcription factor domain-containing protein n=1 Tax=Aspergillus lentulus TaxID=293939 RepID=A0AAN5YJ31_ASPLE|nr:hypothetical protein CNMCM6936_001766 [Aspergillus lentulus]KAF4171576.1 hypothetical protein CNMCM8060_002686 [Aspergillus lentulus]KAF4179569.1 hypothetical protein CNMCM7927_001818 [Aspergillus lentulus]KAF4194024.1 hypothetical protein CNMCM8694_008069 [Aspergillus lentulus]KAF4201235.1 hypothetical protein CNMCM8927_001883 [Aspergillus lentulus]